MTARDLWAVPRVGAPEVAPDGSGLVVPVTTYDIEENKGRSRLHWISTAGDAAARPLTAPDASSGSPAISPDGKWLAFTRKDGKEKPQLHLLPLLGGESEKLTDLPLGAFDPRWLPGGKGIVFGSTLLKGHLTIDATRAELERREKDPVKAHVTEDRVFRYWDSWLTTGEVPHLFLFDLASRKLRDLIPESTVWFDWMDPAGQYDVAPDGSEIAYSGIQVDEGRSLLRSALYVVPVDGGAPSCLTPDHPADDARPRYTPDGRGIVYGMTHDPFFYADRVRLMHYDRGTREHRAMLADWHLSPSSWTPTRHHGTLLEAEDRGRASLFGWDSVADPYEIVAGGSVHGAVAAPDGSVYFTLETLCQPPEVYRVAADGRGLRRLTTFTEPALSGVALGEVREHVFQGAEGAPVQMFVVMPPGWKQGEKRPLVHVIHGGPHGISADGFHFRWNAQAFAAMGYVTALVNFQGSTSWGQDFAQRIQGEWPDRPHGDVMKATDLLVESGLVDPARMAATGGSYGGYLVSWIAAHTDRFKCVVNHAGVFDTLSQYASDVTQGRAQSFGGEPWDGIDRIDRTNPARFMAGCSTPMLVIHGEKDYRVPVTQGLECYGMLKAKGVPARLVYFPDENHWVLKPRNSILWYREVAAWLRRFLGQ
ncbi:MAG: S9 family peptidase [Acidobacteriota bacterium]